MTSVGANDDHEDRARRICYDTVRRITTIVVAGQVEWTAPGRPPELLWPGPP